MPANARRGDDWVLLDVVLVDVVLVDLVLVDLVLVDLATATSRRLRQVPGGGRAHPGGPHKARICRLTGDSTRSKRDGSLLQLRA
jgi:hypothetical protein